MKTSAKRSLSRLAGQYSYILVFVAIFLVWALTSSSLTWSGVMNIFRHSAVIGVLALGMGLVCLTGEIDLSVGSILAIDAGLSVVVFNATGSILLTLVFALAAGAVLGAVNGVLVGIVEMPAFIVTLATMLIYRSLAQYLCQHLPKELIGGGSSVYKMDTELAAYQPFYGFGNGKIATLPLVGLVLLALTVVFVYLSTSTKFGKKVYAIGSNQKGARLAAFLWIAMNGSADPATTGSSYEMYAIASVVLGGISMAGGRGRCLGVLFGAMSYTIIDKIIVALKMDSLINDAIKGVILILVILIQVAGPRVRKSCWNIKN